MHKSSDVNNLKENPFFKNTKAGKIIILFTMMAVLDLVHEP